MLRSWIFVTQFLNTTFIPMGHDASHWSSSSSSLTIPHYLILPWNFIIFHIHVCCSTHKNNLPPQLFNKNALNKKTAQLFFIIIISFNFVIYELRPNIHTIFPSIFMWCPTNPFKSLSKLCKKYFYSIWLSQRLPRRFGSSSLFPFLFRHANILPRQKKMSNKNLPDD